MRPLISFNYGAGEKLRVSKIFKTALSIIIIVMTMGTLLCMIIPEHLIGLFSSNELTVSIGCSALRFISIGFIVSSISITVSGALEALGKGFASLIISFSRYIAVMLSISYILNAILGASGVWNSFWITEFIVAFFSYCMYKKIQ